MLINYNKINLKIKKEYFKINNFPFNNYKIIQLSDIHLGFGTKKGLIKQIVLETIKCNPNLVVITGDLLEGNIYQFFDELQYFKNITHKIDTYFVYGNHDFQYNSIQDVLSILKALGIKTLINKSVWVGSNNLGFNLVGIGDAIAIAHQYHKCYHPNIEQSLRNIKKNAPTILLSHRPILQYGDKRYNIDLILSGHLHGGQIYPFGLLVSLLKEDSGKKLCYKTVKFNDHRYIFVSKGIGFTRLPFRLFSQSEINMITINPV